jgi:[acyl-carrier-protein] S-malonyltransferase
MGKEAFVFPGQGSQYVGMSERLLNHRNPELAGIALLTYEEASDVSGIDIIRFSLVGPKDDLDRTKFTQPTLLTTSVAALRILEYFDRKPDIVAGHSLGKFSALVATRAIGFEQAVRIVTTRGRFMAEAGERYPGSMASLVKLDLGQVEEICLQTGAQIANINELTQIVISGTKESVESASEIAKSRKGLVFPLPVSIASHSSLMAEAEQRLRNFVRCEIVYDPEVPIILNSTASVAETAEDVKREMPELTGRVLWQQTMEKLVEAGVKTVTEVGPGQVLTRMAKRNMLEVEVYNSDTLIPEL